MRLGDAGLRSPCIRERGGRQEPGCDPRIQTASRPGAEEHQHAILLAETDEQAKLIGPPNQVDATRANLEKRAPQFADAAAGLKLLGDQKERRRCRPTSWAQQSRWVWRCAFRTSFIQGSLKREEAVEAVKARKEGWKDRIAQPFD